VHCPTSVADLYFSRVSLTPGAIRLRVQGMAVIRDGEHPEPHRALEQALTEVSVTDDNGGSYRLPHAAAARVSGRGTGRRQ
jgi:hypothetical protein